MSGPSYDPLPLHAEHRDDVPYNTPMSPRVSGYGMSETEPLEPHDDLPPGAMRPRFLGTALQDDGPQPRQSYADSNASFPTVNDDYQSSVYGLNPAGQHEERSSFYPMNYRDDPHDSDFASSSNTLTAKGMQSSPYLAEKRGAYPTSGKSRRRWWIIGASALVVIVAAVAVIVVLLIMSKHNSSKSGSTSGGAAKGSDNGDASSSSDPSKPAATGTPSKNLLVTGGDGSKVTMDDGSTFTYANSFGGYWYWDSSDPFNNGARAQSWSPALNETFRYGIDQIRGYVSSIVHRALP